MNATTSQFTARMRSRKRVMNLTVLWLSLWNAVMARDSLLRVRCGFMNSNPSYSRSHNHDGIVQRRTTTSYPCGSIASCFIRDLNTNVDVDLDLNGGETSYRRERGHGYSIRCDTSGAIDTVSFHWDHQSFQEWSPEWWMRGNRRNWVNHVSYLGSCGSKVVRVDGAIWTAPCFATELKLYAQCDKGNSAVPPPPSNGVNNTSSESPTVAPIAEPTDPPHAEIPVRWNASASPIHSPSSTQPTECPTAVDDGSSLTLSPSLDSTSTPSPQQSQTTTQPCTPRPLPKSPAPTQPVRGIKTAIDAATFTEAPIAYSPGTKPATPEGKALRWLIEDDPLQLEGSNPRLLQRYALLTLFFAQTKPWANAQNWLSAEECTWFGVICDKCGVVIGIDLTDNGVESIVPEDFALLSNLRELWLGGRLRSTTPENRFMGSIPDSLATLDIEIADLSFTKFSSSPTGFIHEFPEWIVRDWPNLKHLDLYFSTLGGSLPENIGSLTSMEYFDMKLSFFGGPLPSSVAEWTKIQHFESDLLAGRLPDTIAEWSDLEYLAVEYNIFSSETIPSFVGQWTNLRHFEFNSRKDTTGALPSSIGYWSNLETFRFVDENFFTGITGEIPTTVGSWSNLKSFTLQYADVVGGLPESVSNWTSLRSFELLSCGVADPLPNGIGKWTDLTKFYAYDNRFLPGNLPTSIGQLTNMEVFTFSRNTITEFPLPSSIGAWSAVKRVQISEGGIGGTLPESIGNWTAIEFFEFTGNPVSGSLPESIGNWHAISDFKVERCGVTGILPSSIGKWTSLEQFKVSSNRLSGPLPQSLEKWSVLDLTVFDINDNVFEGTLPLYLGQWTGLTSFDISSNSFGGTVPEAIGDWTATIYASFDSNKLVGSFPTGPICNVVAPPRSQPRVLEADCTSELLCTCCTLCL